MCSGRASGAFRTGSGPVRNAPERTKRTKIKELLSKSEFRVSLKRFLMLFWVAAGTPKSLKNGCGADKMHPKTALEAFCVDFSCRCRSESLSGPIFGRSDPRKLCSHHSGSTILTKSPCLKKTSKRQHPGTCVGTKNV